MTQSRKLKELLAVDDSAWPIVQGWIEKAENSVVVLPANDEQRERALVETQVTTRSPMGAIVYHTGGILVDGGWLRLLGSGSQKLSRSLPGWNRGRSTDASGQSMGFLLIADDIVGGFFALNGGAFGPEKRQVFYFAPDSLRWEPMSGMGYSAFVQWSLSPNLASFYGPLRWNGWQSEIASISGDEAISFYPFLWTKEGKELAKCSRKVCPVAEIFNANVIEFPEQLKTVK